MEENMKTTGSIASVKKRLLSALAFVLIGAILMSTVTYAWFILSKAPEVTGVSTSVGANGALEIALLNTQTRAELDAITANIGDSAEAKNVVLANTSWGNIVELADKSYGLQSVRLMPARLQLQRTGGSYTVGSGLLSIPTYGYDGRIVKLENNTITTVRTGNAFVYTSGEQTYGVRAVGRGEVSASAQGTALGLAKVNVSSYSASARSTAANTLRANGSGLVGILMNKELSTNYTDAHVSYLKNIIVGMNESLDYIELSMRYGFLGVAASKLSDSNAFSAAQATIMGTETQEKESLSKLAETYGDDLSSEKNPVDLMTCISKFDAARNSLNSALNICNSLHGDSYKWEDISPAFESLVNINGVFVGDRKFSEINTSDLMTAKRIEMTFGPDCGLFATVADFVGNIGGQTGLSFEFASKEFISNTQSLQNPSFLSIMSGVMMSLAPADGSVAVSGGELKETFGYAIDLAFRCNAPAPDLLLQTAPAQRMSGDATPTTQGGGSYMRFSTADNSFTAEKMINLMDAVRVGFIDEGSKLLGVAKLNISNRIINEDGSISASLFLYDYEVDNQGKMIVGERRGEDNKITDLKQNVAKVVTAVVWLDGDLVDNTDVSATAETTLNGTMNLQFSTSADLLGANVNNISDTRNQAQLKELIAINGAYAELIAEGQGTYTDSSWLAYRAAYDFASTVADDSSATASQIHIAFSNLEEARAGLVRVSKTSLNDAIAAYREMMGTSDAVAGYAINGEFVQSVTQENKDSADKAISAVSYDKNFRDAGNGFMDQIYTEDSWRVMALALYKAEAVQAKLDKATEQEIRTALDALAAAERGLKLCAYYVAYDFDGALYYKVVNDVTDTYGKWYDSEFKRIISEKMILDLDTRSTEAKLATIECNSWWAAGVTKTVEPVLKLNSKTYPALLSDEIIGTSWSQSNGNLEYGMTEAQRQTLHELVHQARDLSITISDFIGGHSGCEEFAPDNSFVSKQTVDGWIISLSQSIEETIATNAYNKRITDEMAEIETRAGEVETAISNAETAIQIAEDVLKNAENAKTAADTAVEADPENEELKTAAEEAAAAVQTAKEDVAAAKEALEIAKEVVDKTTTGKAMNDAQTALTAAEDAVVSAEVVANVATEAAETDPENEALKAASQEAEAAVTKANQNLTAARAAFDTAAKAYEKAYGVLFTRAKATVDEEIAEANKANAAARALQKELAEQRQVLQAAITEAYGIEGCKEGGTNAALFEVALASERVLKKGSSLETIEEQIDTINSALVAVGGTERNKNNSLYENLTVNELGIRTVLNKLEPRSVVLGNAAGIDVSDGSVGATILTRNGVVYSATNVQVGFYNMADGVKITIEGMEDSTADVFAPTRGKEQFPVDVAWGVSATGKRISVELQSPKNAKGGVEKQHSETIQSVTWATDDISVAKVASSTAASTKITALKPGTTRLTVSVTTQQGNTYTDEIVINADIPTVSFTVEGNGTYTLTAVYTDAIAVANQETPVSYAWSINSSSAELNGNDATATLIGLEAGKVKATLKVTTDKEHEYMYTKEIDVVKN